mmetsp:Transcript_53470/g.173977  ORF Transcript_53470/g.173977 Transcript_53470/m.173977 type:complete len:312 (-) Transcript_53470:2547-3482(-)
MSLGRKLASRSKQSPNGETIATEPAADTRASPHSLRSLPSISPITKDAPPSPSEEGACVPMAMPGLKPMRWKIWLRATALDFGIRVQKNMAGNGSTSPASESTGKPKRSKSQGATLKRNGCPSSGRAPVLVPDEAGLAAMLPKAALPKRRHEANCSTAARKREEKWNISGISMSRTASRCASKGPAAQASAPCCPGKVAVPSASDVRADPPTATKSATAAWQSMDRKSQAAFASLASAGGSEVDLRKLMSVSATLRGASLNKSKLRAVDDATNVVNCTKDADRTSQPKRSFPKMPCKCSKSEALAFKPFTA